jgi:GNAT superfamily N-acetyltransferase
MAGRNATLESPLEAAKALEEPFYTVTPRTGSEEFDRIDIDLPSVRIGNVRCQLLDDKVIIYSIQIFPEYQRNGYGRAAVNMLKHRARTLVADRVRFTARTFWEKMGFKSMADGNWIFHGVRSTKFTSL